MPDVSIREVVPAPPAGWDALTVDPPGGHVLQGSAWAGHRAAQGWSPHFVTFDDGRAALVLTHPHRPLPGFVAYVPRGPVSAGDPLDRVVARAASLARWARRSGGVILAVDPELDADDGYERSIATAGFRPTEEIQPSRHRMVLTWAAGEASGAILGRVAKATRQRIRAAEASGTRIEDDTAGRHLEAFARLSDATAERKGFDFEAGRGFVAWWRRVLAADRARFWVAIHGGEVLGGLLAYRQGGRYATAFSADRADLRSQLPGTMHLLRWHAIEAAVEAGHASIDLGGVDVRGARRRPEPGDPTYGLFEHKASFGARFVESAGAHEIVLRPWVYRLALAGRSMRRLPGRLGSRIGATLPAVGRRS